MMSRLSFAILFLLSLSPVFAQAPAPVPALPDTERRTTYTISASTCACAVGFQLYGDSTDYANWLTVWVNGVQISQAGNWTLTSPSGSLATLPRPITDAVLTFTNAQTGTVQIVGARRPRRVSQFSENRGVAARDLNQAISDLEAQTRELWDRQGRTVQAPPGDTLNLLPVLASRQNLGACFDSGGNLTSCASVPSTTFSAGNGITFTGVSPTTIANNIAAGNGIAITGTNPLTVTNNIQAGSGVTFTGTNPIVISIPPSNIINVLSNGLVADLQSLGDGACNSNTTFTSATANFVAGDVGKAISIAGCGAAGATLVTTIAARVNSTTVTLNAAASVTTTGKLFQWGTDNTTPLNTLLGTLTAGGTVYFPTGNYGFTGKINITHSSITLLGQGPNASTALWWIGAGSANFFDVQSVSYTLFQQLTMRSSVADWTGWMITIRNSGGGDPANNILNQVTVSPSTLSSGLLLDTAIETTVIDTRFSGGKNGISGRQTGGSYSNVFRMMGGQFLNQTSTAVGLGGDSWSFNNVAFENRADGKLVAYTGDTTVPANGLSFIGCWFGDATVAGSNIINYWGNAFTFTGNFLAGGGVGDTAIVLNSTKGFTIGGNQFKFLTNVVNYATATVQGGLISGNAYATGVTLEASTANKDASVINTGNIAF